MGLYVKCERMCKRWSFHPTHTGNCVMSAAGATFSLESGGQKKGLRELKCVQIQFDGTMKLMLRANTQGRGGPISSLPGAGLPVYSQDWVLGQWAGSH